MNLRTLVAIAATMTFAADAAQNEPRSAATNPEIRQQRGEAGKDQQSRAFQSVIAQWPARPKLGAEMMFAQYGMPQEITLMKVVWHNQGPYKRITVTNHEEHHDFPLPHTDFLEHTVNYNVPPEKADELAKFDGSCTYDRTQGELSARCDLEGHNILTLNLANDIATGKMSADDARKAFSDNVVQDALGKNPKYVTALQFRPPTMAAFSDQPTIPGSPVRPDERGANVKGASNDGEVLGFLSAVDLNEIGAAGVAAKKRLNSQVSEYASMLHKEHGENLQQTFELGQQIGVTPLVSPAVDALRVKGAGELATLVPLDGNQFSNAFISAMIKGHTEVLGLIDNQLTPKASNDAVKKHLSETRQHVAAHLQAAQRLQSAASIGGAAQAESGQQNQPSSAQRRQSAEIQKKQ